MNGPVRSPSRGRGSEADICGGKSDRTSGVKGLTALTKPQKINQSNISNK